MSNDILAKQILKNIRYAALATVSADGIPWNTPILYAFDNRINIYWSSHPKSVHSSNIDKNGQAFIVIYNSKAGEGDWRGLYLETRASQLSDENEIKYALNLLGERRGKPFKFIDKFIDNSGSQRIYKAKVKKIWLNDAEKDDNGDFIKDYRIEVQL